MAFPTTGVLDSFAYSDGALATVSGGAWSSPVALDFNVSASTLFALSGSGAVVTYATGGNYNNNVECYITVTQLPGAGEVATTMWIDGSGNGYGVRYTHGSPGTLEVGTVAGYAFTALGASASVTLSAGDQIGLWVNGSTIKGYSATGGVWTEQVSRTDSTYSSARRIGLGCTGTTAGFDSFGGGNGPVSGAPAPIMTLNRGFWGVG